LSSDPGQDAVNKARAFFNKQGIALNNTLINRLLREAETSLEFKEPTERDGIRDWMIQKLLAKPYQKTLNNGLEKLVKNAGADLKESQRKNFIDPLPTIGEIREAIRRENKTAPIYVTDFEKEQASVAKEEAEEAAEATEEVKKAAAKQAAINFFTSKGINLGIKEVKQAITRAEVMGSFKPPINSVVAELQLSNNEKKARNNKKIENTIKEELEDMIV
jgi:hypothetical protein